MPKKKPKRERLGDNYTFFNQVGNQRYTYIHTYIHKYISTYLPAYLPAY